MKNHFSISPRQICQFLFIIWSLPFKFQVAAVRYVFCERGVNTLLRRSQHTKRSKRVQSWVMRASHFVVAAVGCRRLPSAVADEKVSRKKNSFRFERCFLLRTNRPRYLWLCFVCAFWYWPHLTRNVICMYLHLIHSSKYIHTSTYIVHTFIYLFFLSAQFVPLQHSFCNLRALNACKMLFITLLGRIYAHSTA